MKCANCGTELMAGAKFCFMCGTKQEEVCPVCGAKKAMEGARFCMMCGAAFGQTETVQPAAAAQSDRAPKLPISMHRSYSNYQTFASWNAGNCRFGAGNPDCHYLIEEEYSGKKLIAVSAQGAEAKEIKNLPFDSKHLAYVFWADGMLWVTEADYGVAFRIYAMDPDTCAFKLEADLSSLAGKGEIWAPYVTESSIYIRVSMGDWGRDNVLLRWDRKACELTTLLRAQEIEIGSFDDQTVWASVYDGEENRDMLISSDGKRTACLADPVFIGLIDAIRSETQNPNLLPEHCLGYITYVDFSAKKAFFSKRMAKAEGRWLNFDGSYTFDTWMEPFDFSMAKRHDRDREIECASNLWYSLKLFDGHYAVGQFHTGSNYNWGYVNEYGNAIDLGMFDREHNTFVLLGDDLYIKGESFGSDGICRGWHKFRLGGSGAQMQFVKCAD